MSTTATHTKTPPFTLRAIGIRQTSCGCKYELTILAPASTRLDFWAYVCCGEKIQPHITLPTSINQKAQCRPHDNSLLVAKADPSIPDCGGLLPKDFAKSVYIQGCLEETVSATRCTRMMLVICAHASVTDCQQVFDGLVALSIDGLPNKYDQVSVSEIVFMVL